MKHFEMSELLSELHLGHPFLDREVSQRPPALSSLCDRENDCLPTSTDCNKFPWHSKWIVTGVEAFQPLFSHNGSEESDILTLKMQRGQPSTTADLVLLLISRYPAARTLGSKLRGTQLISHTS